MSDDFSGNLRCLRIKKGLTQKQLAEKLGVSFATVNRWENNQNMPSSLAIVQLRTLLGANLTKPEKSFS